MNKVLVLNTDMSIMDTTSWQEAVKMVVSKRAEVIQETNIRIHPTMFRPAVIRLIKIVRHLWRKRVPWTKANVHTRDNNTCQYCGVKLEKSERTIDHVIPKDQGGKNGWENTVCSCFACNNMKHNRTPSQARMTLRKQPYQPTIMEFILKKVEADGATELMKTVFSS